MKLIEQLNWRYATKKFDPSKKINTDQLELLKEAIRLSPSSYGLQLYKVLIVENEDIRKELQKSSWGQSQITDASHLVVFCSVKPPFEKQIENLVKLKASAINKTADELKAYSKFMNEKLSEKSEKELMNWTAKQTYISMSNLLNACSELKIDSCPIEGFSPTEYNQILNLEEKGLQANVVVAIGYRSKEDVTQFIPKVRKPKEELFITV